MKKLSFLFTLIIFFCFFSIPSSAYTQDDIRIGYVNGTPFCYCVYGEKYAKLLSYGHFIPDKIDGYTVATIGSSAFSTNDYDADDGYVGKLMNLEIPDSVTCIEAGAFHGNGFFKKITIPSSVTYIGKGAFEGMQDLREINIPEGISKIEPDTFNKCYRLKKVKFPSELEFIGTHAFDNCPSLKNYDFTEYSDLTLKKKCITNKKAKIITTGSALHIHRYAAKNDLKCIIDIKSNNAQIGQIEVGNAVKLLIDGKAASFKPISSKYIKLSKNGKLYTLQPAKKAITINAITEEKKEFVGALSVVGNFGPMRKLKNDEYHFNQYKTVKSITVKKGQSIKIQLYGKLPLIDNKYTSTKKAVIIGNKSDESIRIKGISKGTSTVKLRMNGVKTFKIKVKTV